MTAGAAVLVALGAPNRRPTPAAVAGALRDGGLGGRRPRRSSGPTAVAPSSTPPHSTSGDRAFVKVYARDSRDADLLYRGYRTALLRGPNDDWPSR